MSGNAVARAGSWKSKRKPSKITLKDFKGQRYVENKQHWSKSDRETKTLSNLSRSWKGNKREKYVLLFMVTRVHVLCKQQLSCLQDVCISMLRIQTYTVNA